MSTVREEPGPPTGERKLSVGDTLGRYRITGELGTGGMGEVYLAVDPQLDRQVALKVLRAGERSVSGVTRLLREARAMARVSHRNVVAVYDAGELGGQPWVAMELIRGSTLRAWLEEHPRTWPEVVRVLLDAGRGLEAAHAAGLVHRDFKPENVLVDTSGRVVVSDFGIAHGVTDEDVPLAAPSSLRLDERITAAGALLGTPAYMAPEQHQGRTDARSDQYAFAVTAREALSGLPARALATPLPAEAAAAPPPDAKRADVPARVWRTLGRGLAADPALRFPSMAALLGELEAALPRRRSGWAWAAAALLTLLAGAGVVVLRQQRCDSGPSRFAAAWNAERQEKLRTSLGAAAPVVVDGLEAFATRWLTMHREACEATVSGAQSAAMLDQRMACLARRQSDFSALVSRLEARGADLVEVAPNAVRALGDVTECADTATLGGRPAVPQGRQAEVDALGARLSDLKAQEDLGQYRELLEPGAQLVADARRLGYAPLEAEALRVLGRSQHLTDALVEAEKTLEQGIVAAERARDDRLRASLHSLRSIVFFNNGRLGEARRDLAAATAIAERVGDTILLRKIRGLEGDVAIAEGRFAEAEPLLRGVVEADEADQPIDERRLIADLNSWATALRKTKREAEAARQWERAVTIGRRVLSPTDPGLGVLLAEWADTRAQLGDLDGAQSAHDEAVRVFSEAIGPRSAPVAEAHSNWGRLLARAGRYPAARAVLETSLAIRREAADPQPFTIADSLVSLADLSLREHRDADAEKSLAEALPLLEQTIGRTNPSTVESLVLQALARSRLGRGREASATLDDARARLEEGQKAGVSFAGDHELGLALALVEVRSAARDCAAAMATLSAAQPLAEQDTADPDLRATWKTMREALSKGCVPVHTVP